MCEERVEHVFKGLTDPSYSTTVNRFFREVSEDAQWCVLETAAERSILSSKEAYTKKLEKTAQFTMELLDIFGIAPLCMVCPGQDSRTTYKGHVCGRAHFGFVFKHIVDRQASPWQKWSMLLGEVMVNYVTGELWAKRFLFRPGLNIYRVQDLPASDIWYCVSSAVCCPISDNTQGDWMNLWPNMNGGKPRWKQMMQRPAEQLVMVLQAHGIEDHACPFCESGHSLWATTLMGPKHYATLSAIPNLVNHPLRKQRWLVRGGAILFDHLTGEIYLLCSREPARPDFPVAPPRTVHVTVPAPTVGPSSPAPDMPAPGMAPGQPGAHGYESSSNKMPNGQHAAPTQPPAPERSTASDVCPPCALSAQSGAQQSGGEQRAAQAAEPWVRNILSEMRPGTIFEEYCDPVTGEFWWHDVVSHEPLYCKPSPPALICLPPNR
ncbi:unnamed protein product [Effrenium voratum]|nr:unnamed protein product [Effrenium voratum]